MNKYNNQSSLVNNQLVKPSTPVENIRLIRPFLQNKPNLPHFSPENDDLTQKQTQYKPKQSQFWLNIKGVKAKTKPIKPNNHSSACAIGRGRLMIVEVIFLEGKIYIMEKYSPDKKYNLMTKDQVRAVDSWAINEIGIPGVVLMENAGRSCAELIKEKLKGKTSPMVCIFCGTGNNGGDGYVIARHLLNTGYKVTVVICGDREKVKGDAKINLDILEKMDQPVEQLNTKDEDIPTRIKEFTADADMIVDGLFGTGLSGQLRDDYIKLIENINAVDCPIMAVDIPSGLDCDTGKPLGTAIKANCTVTFVAVKKGFTAESAHSYTGEIYIASIGIEPDS